VNLNILEGERVGIGMNNRQPIRQHPDNPHYFLFRGMPTILVTSAEHYGAVINLDFDYIPYLDTLHAYGLNYTRIYPGTLLETDGAFVKDNTLGPRCGRHIVPWARSTIPGFALGNRFDLDKWDPAYFERLRDFIVQAGKREIVVELCLFNGMYEEFWPVNPLYHENNLQGIGTCRFNEFQTLADKPLVARQEAFVEKIIREVNDFDNIILEIVDEPSIWDAPPAEFRAWTLHMLEFAYNVETKLSKRHLIAQMQDGKKDSPADFADHPLVSVITGQYTYGSTWDGALRVLELEYEHDKPVEFNETNRFPAGYKGDVVSSSRTEAWEFIVGGGAGFNQLNSIYTILNPAGKAPENEKTLTALQNLKNFIYGFDFVKMRRDMGCIRGGAPSGAFASGMSEPGRQYALYMHHSEIDDSRTIYIVRPGEYQEKIQMDIGKGDYIMDWVDPASGRTIRSEQFAHNGGIRIFTTPVYSIDIALRIKSICR